jgi:hypothetical protein
MSDDACTGGSGSTENCTNGQDDDGDGAIDCGDPDCEGVTPNCTNDDGDETVCDDFADGDNGDGTDGYIDCSDGDCASDPYCMGE